MATNKSKRQARRARPKKRPTRTVRPRVSTHFLGNDKELPGQRVVQFPQVKGKTTEKIEFFTTGEYHSITIDFDDQTSLNFAIEPGFTINADLQQRRKDETNVLMEWPPIPSER